MKSIIVLIVICTIVGIGFLYRRQQSEPVKTNQQAMSTESNSSTTTAQNTMNLPKTYDNPPEMTIDVNASYTAVIKTNKGDMIVDLFPVEAPNTVNNFIFLSKEGFYNNTPFHRVISGFMIQGGDPTGTGTGGPGYRFADEEVKRDYTRGTIAMANAGPNTNGSQFFIMHNDSSSLPKDYVIFGSIDSSDSASLKTLDMLLATPVTMSMSGERSKPTEDLRIQEIIINQE